MGSTTGVAVRRVFAATLVLVAVVATGCLHADVDVTVEGDGSGQIVVEVFPSRKMQDELEKLPIEIEDLVEGSFDGVNGAEFDEIEDGDRTGYRLVVPFDDYRDVQQILVDGGSVAGQQVQLFSTLNIVELPDDAGWQLDAQILPLGQTIAGANAGVIPESMQDVIDSAGIGNNGSGLDLSISLPGTIISSNATSTDGGTATWKLDDPEAPGTLQMRTEPEDFPTVAQMVVGGAGLALVLGIGLFVLGATRKHASTKAPRQRRQRRSRDRVAGQPDGDWAAPVPGAAPSEASARPEPLPPLATGTAVAPPPPLVPAAPIPPSPWSAPAPTYDESTVLPVGDPAASGQGLAPTYDESVGAAATDPIPSGHGSAPTYDESSVPPATAAPTGWEPPAGLPAPIPPPTDVLPVAEPEVEAAPASVDPPAAPPPFTPPVSLPAVDVSPAEPPAAAAPPADSPAAVVPPPIATPAGWYPDPDDPSSQRWWSGSEWTEHRA